MEEKVLRKCRKCLLREAFPEDYERYVAVIIERMKPEERAETQEFQRRMECCRQCEKLQNGTCMACGCMVEIRGMQRKGKCPCRRW